MEQQQPQARPPAFVSHNPTELKLPSVPKTDINHAHAVAELSLPDLKTVLSPGFQATSLPSDSRSSTIRHESPGSVRSLPRMDPGPQFEYRGGEVAVGSPSEIGSAMSVDESAVRSPSVSIDDPDVRIAAEALSGLGNPSFARAPSAAHRNGTPRVKRSFDQQEPLFQMFAKAHPWASGAINGSLTAYSTTKNYSPRLVQYGAQLIEDKIALPVATTVGNVGRVTGVENGIRWYYRNTARQDGDLESGHGEPASKRRHIEDEKSDDPTQMDSLARFRSGSQEDSSEQLPAYGASKPPSYREEASPHRPAQVDRDQARSLASQVLVMTSGLGVALSETSRRSLRYCLNFLARQAEHITTVMHALRLVLNQYDQARDAWHENNNRPVEKGERPRTPDHDEAARRLAEIIKTHSEDIWNTLQSVVTSVSSYAGGALPENARHFVKTQLMSLPHRWRFVSDRQTGDSETSRGAHRMVAFATEGLDMIAQVTQTLELTLNSAEQWLARVGRRVDSEGLSDRQMMEAPRMDVEKQ